MEKLFKTHTVKLLSILFIILQFIQPLMEVQATTAGETSDGIEVVSAKQTSNSTISLELAITNSSSTARTDEIELSNGLTAEAISQAKVISDKTKDELGTYDVADNKITVQTNPNITQTVDATLNLNFSTIDSSVNNTVMINDKTTTIQPLATEASTQKSSTSSNTTTRANTLPSALSTTQSSLMLSTTTLLGTSGNDISQYLPDSSNGTIITSTSLTFTDTNGNVVSPNAVTKNTNLSFDYQWAIPNDLKDSYQLKAGDYFTFNLPEGITYKPGTGSLGDFGTYSIAADGTVTFTFNAEVENYDTISGNFQYTSTVNASSSTGKETIVIDTTTGQITIPIVVQPTGGNSISKTGALTGANSSNNNPTGITWDVTINTNAQELTNATVSDPMPTDTTGNVSTTLNTVEVYPLTVDLSGNVTATGTALVEGQDYTVDANGKITFIGAYADTYQAFKIEYTSSINTSQIPDNGGNVTFNNTATLTNDGNDATAQASVTANYGKLLAKSFDGADSNGGQKYNWHINYNYGEKALPVGTSLTDTLSTGQVFSGTPALVYEDGTTVDASLYSIAYSSDNTQMTITFTQGLSRGVKISYQSQVTAPINDAGTTISNSVSSDGQTAESNGNQVSSQALTKTLGTVDYNAKTVAWNFNINMARQDMSNWSMTDPVPTGLTVNYDSFVLKDKDTNTTLVEGTDYTITPDGNGFTISFAGDLASHAKDWYTLSYTTDFETYSLPNNGKWTNTATATWTDQSNNTHTNNSSADFTPKVQFVNDGSKSGSYNAVTKQITWTVVANYNQRELQSASITDPIIGDQDYVANSAKLYEATINSNGTYTLGAQVSQDTIAFDADNKTITAQLPEGSTEAYVLTYQTSLADRIIDQTTYNNTATYLNASVSNNLTAQVAVPNSGNLVDKTGEQDPSNSAYALWNIWVNKAQSTISNAVLTDNPSDNQIIDESSIVIYPGIVATNGSFTENTANPLILGQDYTVDLQTDNVTGEQTLKITFTNEISSAYSIHYRALINSSKINDTLTNAATLTGDGEKDVSDSTSGTTSIVNNTGSATGQNTNIVLTKTDANTGNPIIGATFELWSDVSGQKVQMLRTATTDDSGKLTWNNLKSGKYILVETSAPEGYVISSNLAQGQEINIQYSEADSNNDVQLAETNQQGEITIQKTDGDTGNPLAGAVFDLYQQTEDGDVKIASNLTTNLNGTVSYNGLDAGDYYVVETSAPAGYVLDTTPHDVTIDGTHIQQTVNITNAEKTGSVLLTKTDGDTNAVLPNAVFALYKSDGTQIQTGLTTDSNGQITVSDLKPGDYYFQETAAPAGYILDDSRLDFTIVLQTTSTVATVSAENAEKTGSVVLTKTDSDTGQVLPGATFSLFDHDGNEVESGLVTDEMGQITVNDLKPGDYYFQETATLPGYVLDMTQHHFTVDLQITPTVATVSVGNSEKTGSVVLTKTDSDTGQILPGATFDLYQANGNKIQSDLITDLNGQITVGNLKPGDYYFQETAAPAGYNFDSTSQYHFTVDFQTTPTVATVSVGNSEKTGSVVLTKTDSDTGKILPGATFDLYQANGDKLQSDLTTDENGQITVNDLKPGDYYFQETSAPAGYVLNDKKLDFTIALQTTSKVATVSAENAEKTGSVILTKTDRATGKLLANAKFSLYREDGKLVKKGLLTNAKGQLIVNDLTPGNYYFQETSAPKGYVLTSKNRYAFTIQFQATPKTAKVFVQNTKQKIPVVSKGNLPKTGEQSNLWLMASGWILAAAALIIGRRIKKS